MRFHPSSDSRDQSPIPQRNKNGIELFVPSTEFDRDGACALRDFCLPPIFDETRLSRFRKPTRLYLCDVKVGAEQLNLGSQFTHTLYFQRICFLGRKNNNAKSSLLGRIRQTLTKVTCRGANERPGLVGQTGHEKFSAPSLEGSNRINGFNFQHQVQLKLAA